MEESMLHTGRYEREFKEISKIGKGGGGKVIKGSTLTIAQLPRASENTDGQVLPCFKLPDWASASSHFEDEFMQLGKVTLCCKALTKQTSYLVCHRLDDQIYAVKKIKIISTDAVSIEQICREVKTLAEVSNSSCPSIVRYHTAWLERTDEPDSEPSSLESECISEDDNNDSHDENSFIVFKGSQDSDSAPQMRCMLYIQMELCGKPLSDWLEERNKDGQPAVNRNQNFEILRQVLEGLHSLHQKGIIHRDLKPSNIFVIGHGPHVKIGDFGFSRKICQDGEDHELSSDVGTALYMAPEVKKGNDYDTKADMFSLGILLCELFSPFKTGCERISTLSKVGEKQCVSSEFHDRWPKVAAIVERLIRHDKNRRPNASQLLKIPESRQLLQGDVVMERLISENQKLTSKVKRLKGSLQKQILPSDRTYSDSSSESGDNGDTNMEDDNGENINKGKRKFRFS